MKKIMRVTLLLASAFCFFLTGCSYECDVYYMYGAYGWVYEGAYTYEAGDEDEAHDICEDDWGAAYDCSNCTKVE